MDLWQTRQAQRCHDSLHMSTYGRSDTTPVGMIFLVIQG
jgi:hypothetical protein